MLLLDITNKAGMKPLLEATVDKITNKSEKRLYIEGKMLKFGLINENSRIYDENDMDNAVELFDSTLVTNNQATGEIMHPNYLMLNLREAAIKIVKLTKIPNFYTGKALVLDSPAGNLLRGLLKDVTVGVSSRGEGESVIKSGIEYIKRYILRAIDVVSEASVVESIMTALAEGKLSSNQILTTEQNIIKRNDLDNIITNTDIISLRKKDFMKLMFDIIELSKSNVSIY